MPAFVLQANELKSFWNNVATSGEYAVDILTTISGVGNIAKFRHLSKIATRAEKLRFVSQTGKKLSKAKATVAGGAAVVEISSGTINALIKLTGFNDTPFGKALQDFLFYLELLSLSGELTAAIHNGLRINAKKLVEKPEDAAKLEKQLDDVVVKGELDEVGKRKVLDELEELAELDLMASRKIGNFGGKVATERQIRQLRGVLKQKGVNLILEGDLKSALKQFKPIVIKGEKFDNPNDLFRFMKDNDFVGGFNAETKQFILPRKFNFETKIYENPTEIVLFHEMKHLEHFEEIGEIAYKNLSKLQKETYVWNKILAERGKWTPAELEDALRYINRERKKAGINEPIIIK